MSTSFAASLGFELTLFSIGLPAGAYLKAPVFESVIRMITIKGSYVGNRRDTAEALDFYAKGLIKAPFKVVGLSELPKVFEMMEKGQIVLEAPIADLRHDAVEQYLTF